ncbi:MAG: hypothetical protein OEY59_07765 [Deltaproteobacteria bacterium]|nr:hypothetical protein [Deltaproteobacteria bacterium]
MYTDLPPKKNSFLPVLGFLLLMVGLGFIIFFTHSLGEKVSKIESNQDVILQFLDRAAPQKKKPPVTQDSDDTKKMISKSDFDQFVKKHNQDIYRLKKEIKKLRSML